jgi:hypothetical protein
MHHYKKHIIVHQTNIETTEFGSLLFSPFQINGLPWEEAIGMS